MNRMETKEKNRGWVKNAAIIFLSAMLVLTFFSNTIMNRSLPEAATQTVTGGTISAKVRGTGIVTAKESWQVTAERAGTVDLMLAQVGQEVSAGDVLFILSGEGSGELSAAQETLRQLQFSYQEALIRAADTDYSKEDRGIQQAREALEKAQADLDSLSGQGEENTQESRDIERARAALTKAQETVDRLFVDDRELQAAALEADQAQSAVSEAQAAVDQAQAALDSLGGRSAPDDAVLNSLYSQIQEKQTALQDAGNRLESAKLLYGADYDALVDEATRWIIGDSEEYPALSETAQAEYISGRLPIYLPAAAEQYRDPASGGYRYYEAYEIITRCRQNAVSAQAEYDALIRQYQSLLGQDNSYLYDQYSNALKNAKQALAGAQEVQAKREQALSELQTRQTEYQAAQAQAETCRTALEDLLYASQQQQKAAYQAAQAQVDACRTTLEDLLFALQEQQKADGKTQQIEALNLQKISEQIGKQQTVVDELLAGAGETQVTAKASGVIESIAVTAGQRAAAGETLAVIRIDDMGCSLSFSVTNEQARKVAVGDIAEANGTYGDQISIVLRNIAADPQDPQLSKILTFDVSGAVSVGSALSVTVGQRGAEYETVVPNSAIRSDANGSYVFTVTTKSSPLGSRYIATRVDVAVLASDDSNSAVTGALNPGDYVITTCSKPISGGDKVRMPN